MADVDIDVEVVVVGAGIVGLASAASLVRDGRSVLVVEAHDDIAREGTSRNSEVIHAGLYYPAQSLKARLCREGREILYRRCEQQRIPHRRTGKLVVASDPSDESILDDLFETGTQSGAPGLQMLDSRELRRREPAVTGRRALYSPDSGIVDAHAYARSFQAEAEAGGASLLLRHEVVALEALARGWRVEVRGPARGDSGSMRCRAVVNAAGLASARIAELAGFDLDANDCRMHFCKGDYFALAAAAPIRLEHLVYPAHVGPGLGVHATIDLGGRIRFGPDAEYVTAPHYEIDPGKRSRFAATVRRYLPALQDEWLSPDIAGVRARLAGPGEVFRDFHIAEASEQGLPGLVNCIGIESPGLTAAAAIGVRVAELLAARL